MITPGRLDLTVQRWSPFDYTIQLPVGIDFTGATAAMQARLYRDAPGEPILSLVNASSAGQGLSFTTETTDDIATSFLRIRINETTAEAILLNAGKAGADVVLAYDIHITGGGFAKTRWYEGALIVRAGATQ
ncbi:MAG: hypothetical protein KKG69_18180 [Alphaproteobacteria bacterium]|uniref:Uncharacterized protein n=1 Tax=viral metagenome TaxID=1070528 RepID=A0A6H1ZCH7_9ZZZZ|nr:hypothetical protein [Alphaproteobacteria bacterium]